ncbi:MAG TPA: hypothetical protein VK190_02590 [Pseudoneobacillus sp.]|nr:hypothetical protein [Pseudoneobacillus sp.]
MDKTAHLPIAMLLGTMENIEMNTLNLGNGWEKYTGVTLQFKDIDTNVWMHIQAYDNHEYYIESYLADDNGVLLWYNPTRKAYPEKFSDIKTDFQKETFKKWIRGSFVECVASHKEISASLHTTYDALEKADQTIKDSFVFNIKVGRFMTAYKFKNTNMILGIRVLKSGYDISYLLMGRADGIHHLSISKNKVRKDLDRTLKSMKKPDYWMNRYSDIIRSAHPEYLTDYEKKVTTVTA